MTTGNGGTRPGDLTEAVRTARRGFRADVEVLVRSIDDGELFVPLARAMDGVPAGEEKEVEDDLSLAPHLLANEGGQLYAALFTRPDLLGRLEEELGWQTDGGDLQYCALPARLALDLSLSLLDEETVEGVVLNALHETELILRPNEVTSLAAGDAVPLVGYVQHIPMGADEKTLVSTPDEPLPEDLVQALDRCVAELPEMSGYELSVTFNAERDVEPHPTLRVRTKGNKVDYAAITNRLTAEIEGKVPPPGYIDILFDTGESN